MVTKCANPQCSASFLYLKRGKLFCVLVTPGPGGHEGAQCARYYWLCENCCRRLTIKPAAGDEIEILPRSESLPLASHAMAAD